MLDTCNAGNLCLSACTKIGLDSPFFRSGSSSNVQRSVSGFARIVCSNISNSSPPTLKVTVLGPSLLEGRLRQGLHNQSVASQIRMSVKDHLLRSAKIPFPFPLITAKAASIKSVFGFNFHFSADFQGNSGFGLGNA